MEKQISSILSTLQKQVQSFRATMRKAADEHPAASSGAVPPDLFQGPMIASLLAGEGSWFSQFLHAMTYIRTSQHAAQLLMLATMLCLQHDFKKLLISQRDLQSAFLRPLADFEPETDIDSAMWYRSLVFALVKSKADRPRLIAPELKSAGLTYADQVRLEESISANPELAAGMTSGSDEWAMELEDSNRLLALVFSEEVVKRLVKTQGIEAISCMCRVQGCRPIIVRCSGVQLLLDGAAKATAPEAKEQINVALARLCMTSDPRIWKYPQVVDLANSCFQVICDSSYELYSYEAGIGLINLLSYSEEVLDSLGKRPEALDKFFELITGSDDERVQRTGAELICNMSMSPDVVEQVASGRHSENLRILAFMLEKANPSIQAAASGALAILSGNEELITVMEQVLPKGEILIKLINDENTTPDLEIRVVSIMSNLIEFTSDESLKERLVDGMKAVKKRIEGRGGNNERTLGIVQAYC